MALVLVMSSVKLVSRKTTRSTGFSGVLRLAMAWTVSRVMFSSKQATNELWATDQAW